METEERMERKIDANRSRKRQVRIGLERAKSKERTSKKIMTVMVSTEGTPIANWGVAETASRGRPVAW